jgi:hypothetical protein
MVKKESFIIDNFDELKKLQFQKIQSLPHDLGRIISF